MTAKCSTLKPPQRSAKFLGGIQRAPLLPVLLGALSFSGCGGRPAPDPLTMATATSASTALMPSASGQPSAPAPSATQPAPSQAPSSPPSTPASSPGSASASVTAAATTPASAAVSAEPMPSAGSSVDPSGNPPTAFPFNVEGTYCTFPTAYDNADVQAAYDLWKTTVITADGAGGFLRVKKPDSGSVIGSTVSEGIGYGLLLAVYMNDREVFDNLWKYEQLHLNENGLMHWEIDPTGNVIGNGAAIDGDEDMAWALIMADRLWGGQGTLDDTYLNYAIELINAMWDHEIDHTRDEMVKAGDAWGDVDVTNPSYFAPAYYRVFGEVTGKQADWNKVVDSSYRIIEKSLNAASGNATNGLVPAWCNSAGTPVDGGAGLPMHFQNDSTRTPFRVGQDYCYFGEPRAKAYLEKITSFYKSVGISNIVDGYNLDGTPRPEKAMNGLLPASFVGPAVVGAMYDVGNQAFIDEGYAALATLELTAGTIYYQKSWSALSLLMLSGNFFEVQPK